MILLLGYLLSVENIVRWTATAIHLHDYGNNGINTVLNFKD